MEQRWESNPVVTSTERHVTIFIRAINCLRNWHRQKPKSKSEIVYKSLRNTLQETEAKKSEKVVDLILASTQKLQL